jgi:TonB family protein
MASVNQSGIFYIDAATQGPLSSFPKEYRKRILSGIDRRFSVLFASLAVLFSTIVILLSFLAPPKVDSERQVRQMQERYAQLVLNQPVKPPEKPKEVAKVEQKGTATESNAGKEEAKVDRAKETFVDKQKRKEATVQQRRQQREAMSKQIASAGLFAAITSTRGRGGMGGGGPGPGGMSDLLGAADAVSSLDGISVSRGTFATRNVTSEELKARKANPGERGEVGIQTASVGRADVGRIASAASVNITSEPPEIKGDETQVSTNRACIMRVIQREQSRIKRVYEDWLKRDPTLAGRIKVKFTILAGGAVSDAAVAQSTTNNPGFDANIVRYVQRWDFSSCSVTSPMPIEVPFVFEGQSQ